MIDLKGLQRWLCLRTEVLRHTGVRMMNLSGLTEMKPSGFKNVSLRKPRGFKKIKKPAMKNRLVKIAPAEAKIFAFFKAKIEAKGGKAGSMKNSWFASKY